MSGESQLEPRLLKAGEGNSVWALGQRFTTKLSAGQTNDRFALVEWLVFQSSEPPLHLHRYEDEAWYILDGKMTFYIGDQTFEATNGCFVFAPRGIPHTFTVDVEPTRLLLCSSPAGFELVAVDLGTPADSDIPPSDLPAQAPEVIGQVLERHGVEIVGPPHRLQ